MYRSFRRNAGRWMVASMMRTSWAKGPVNLPPSAWALMATKHRWGALALAIMLGLTGSGYAAENSGCAAARKVDRSEAPGSAVEGEIPAACIGNEAKLVLPRVRGKRGVSTVVKDAAKPKQENSVGVAVSGKEIHPELGFVHKLYRPERPSG